MSTLFKTQSWSTWKITKILNIVVQTTIRANEINIYHLWNGNRTCKPNRIIHYLFIANARTCRYSMVVLRRQVNKDNEKYELTVITSNGNKYNAAKLIESNSFELKRPRCMMQISSAIPVFWWTLVIVRLKINFGMEYSADVIHTPATTNYKMIKIKIEKIKWINVNSSTIEIEANIEHCTYSMDVMPVKHLEWKRWTNGFFITKEIFLGINIRTL